MKNKTFTYKRTGLTGGSQDMCDLFKNAVEPDAWITDKNIERCKPGDHRFLLNSAPVYFCALCGCGSTDYDFDNKKNLDPKDRKTVAEIRAQYA